MIATFTIPKVLVASQNQQYVAMAKEAASMVSGAFQNYSYSGGDSAIARTTDIVNLSTINVLKIDTTSTIDGSYTTSTTYSCATQLTCFKLHNGEILAYWPTDRFCSDQTPSALKFYFDPDGSSTASTTGPGKAVTFFLYPSGVLRTYGTISTIWYSNSTPGSPCSTSLTQHTNYDPPWFSWN